MEQKVNLLDMIIGNVVKYLSKPLSAFVFGCVISIASFYFFIHVQAITDLQKTISIREEDIKICKEDLRLKEELYSKKVQQLEERNIRNQENFMEDLIRANNLFMSIKDDKMDKAQLTRKVADYQQKILN